MQRMLSKLTADDNWFELGLLVAILAVLAAVLYIVLSLT